jgi:hypothetical protein
MKIKATKKEQIEVEISDTERSRIIIEYVEKKYNLNRYWFIENGNLMEEIEHYGSHKFYETKVIREASKTDKKMLEFIKEVGKDLGYPTNY